MAKQNSRNQSNKSKDYEVKAKSEEKQKVKAELQESIEQIKVLQGKRTNLLKSLRAEMGNINKMIRKNDFNNSVQNVEEALEIQLTIKNISNEIERKVSDMQNLIIKIKRKWP